MSKHKMSENSKKWIGILVKVGLLILLAYPVFALRRGGDVGDYHKISIQSCVNEDYAHNPYADKPLSGKNHYLKLSGKELRLESVPFEILPPYDKTKKFSIFVTNTSNVGESCRLDLVPEKSRFLFFAVDGAWILTKQNANIAEIRVHYQDGTKDIKKVTGNVDVWTYGIKGNDSRLPITKMLWSNHHHRKIVVMEMPLDTSKHPKSVEIFGLPAVGMKGRQPHLSLFAITQEVNK